MFLSMNTHLKGRNVHLFNKYVLSTCQILLHVQRFSREHTAELLCLVESGKEHLNECSLDLKKNLNFMMTSNCDF